MKVITFSRTFPAKHLKAGQPTYFREKVWAGLADNKDGFKIPDEITDWDWHEYYNAKPKHHTIRAGNRWKVGDQFSPRVWSGKPYRSKQVEFAPPITIEKIWDIIIEPDSYSEGLDVLINDEVLVDAADVNRLALNDGLQMNDFFDWFNLHPRKKNQVFTGQIICWNPNINY